MKCPSCGKGVKNLYLIRITTEKQFYIIRRRVCWECLNKMDGVIRDTVMNLKEVWKRANRWSW